MKMTDEDKYRLKVIEDKVAKGDLEAMMEYAEMFDYEFQEEITESIAKKMVKCYEACIEAGNLTAALNLGAMYYAGVHIKGDYKKAIKYYEMAAKSENPHISVRAWCNLGYCYYYGRDIAVDDEKAFNSYMRAAIQNDANGLYKIGDMYRYGKYVGKDESMAALFYKRALQEAKNDPAYSDIARRVGECALYGIGMDKDVQLALKMLTLAELYTYDKIENRDPFAASLLPKIQKMLAEAKDELNITLGISTVAKTFSYVSP